MKTQPMMARVGASVMTTIKAMTNDEFEALKKEIENDNPKSKFSMVIEEMIKASGRRR
jgi:hypothetical protein